MAARIEFIPYGERWEPKSFEVGAAGEYRAWRFPNIDDTENYTPIVVNASLPNLTVVSFVKPGENELTIVKLAASSLTQVIHRAAVREDRKYMIGTMRVSHLAPHEDDNEVLHQMVPPGHLAAEAEAEPGGVNVAVEKGGEVRVVSISG